MIYDLPDIVKQWFDKADHDMLNAKLVIDHEPLILDTACFHCQQAMEKYLKAFMVFKKQDVIKTHDIRFLLEECTLLGMDFKNIDIKNIQDFAIDVRYPDDTLSPTLEETKEYFQVASEIKMRVLKKIKE
jgi:HEPN domain-containing protein